ncbi:MAG: hypothetical protein ACKVZH_21165 [Blastocatellia bacterium]
MQPRFIAGFVVLLAAFVLSFPGNQALAQSKQTQEQFFAEVRKSFQQGDFAALDATADQARDSKERFPGADWKLFVFYQSLAWPNPGASSTDQQWKAHLDHFEKWMKASPKSQTARIATANSWVEYAKLARTSDRDWREFDKDVGGKEYQKRLKQAHIALDFDTKLFFVNLGKEAKGEIRRDPRAKLPSLCPHFYYVKLAMEQGRAFDDWTRYNDIFARAVALEPSYYYFYQTKAFDLMIQNQGVKGEWETFAENSIKTISEKAGVAEGDITYYMIVSFVRPRYIKPDGRADFFSDNNLWGQKIWDGYKEIEAKYGTTKFRMNEMALLASKAQQFNVAKILFDRIGDDWDERVWERRAAFDGYRNAAKAKAPTVASKLKTDLAGLKATLSSRQTAYSKSQEATIEAVINSSDTDGDYEVGVTAFSLALRGTAKGAKEVMLLPQVDSSEATQRIEKGGSIRLTYKINFALAAGDYKLKLKSVASNELTIRISPAKK